MNQSISTYRKERGDIVILNDKNRKKFLNELKEGEEYVETLEKGIKLRTHLQNRYFHSGVLGTFVPGHFQTISDAKDYFCREYLTFTDVFDIPEEIGKRGFTKFIIEIMNSEPLNKRREKPEIDIIGDNLWIKWVKSTKYLSTKETNVFIEQISVRASELGLRIPDPDEFNN